MPTIRKILVVLAVILILQFSIFNFQFSIAINPLDKAQEDYTFQFTKYREAQDKYITARSSYLTFKTAVAKSEAFLATKDYLTQVDNLYLGYIFLVNEHGNSLNWTNASVSKDKITSIINAQISYFKDHQEKVSQSATLEELTVLAQDLKNHIDKDLLGKINKTLATFEIVEAESVLADFNQLAGVLDKAMVSKNQLDQNQSFYNNWTSEISDIRSKFENFKDQANALLDKTKEDSATKNELASISNFAQLAKKELSRSKPLFKEVIKIL